MFGQQDTLLIFKRIMFNDYNVSRQVYYIDDIMATDTVKTNIRNLEVTGFTYLAIVNGFQWERRVKGNRLSTSDKNAIKSIMNEGRKLYFQDILVMDNFGKNYKIKDQVIMLKLTPIKYFEQ